MAESRYVRTTIRAHSDAIDAGSTAPNHQGSLRLACEGYGFGVAPAHAAEDRRTPGLARRTRMLCIGASGGNERFRAPPLRAADGCALGGLLRGRRQPVHGVRR